MKFKTKVRTGLGTGLVTQDLIWTCLEMTILQNDLIEIPPKKLMYFFHSLTLSEGNQGETQYGGYPIIKRKVSERDLSREWKCMQTQL